MNMIAVDDEEYALRSLERAIGAVSPDSALKCFLYADEALKYAAENTVDIAFLDIEMSEMHGLILAKKLKDIYGNTNIVFVTGYSEYALDAFSLAASGYVLKPIDKEQVKRQLDNLRYPVKQEDKGIRIQTFGNFDIFVDGKLVPFARAKSKEALAYLVDRKGASVSKKELATVLLEEMPYSRSTQSYLHVIVAGMKNALSEAGINDLIISSRGTYAVDTRKVDCDYYRYNKGDTQAVNSYRGEYMVNYSWAEFTAGALGK